MRKPLSVLVMAVALGATACSSRPPAESRRPSGPPAVASPEVAHASSPLPAAKTPAAPKPNSLVLTGPSGEVTIKLKGMDVYVSDNDQEPELFGIHGDDLVLVGEFPPSVRIGREASWKRAVGSSKGAVILERGGGGKDDEESALVPPGGPKGVVKEGTLVIDRVGERDAKGGTMLEGHLTATIDGKKYDGRFMVTATTWN